MVAPIYPDKNNPSSIAEYAMREIFGDPEEKDSQAYKLAGIEVDKGEACDPQKFYTSDNAHFSDDFPRSQWNVLFMMLTVGINYLNKEGEKEHLRNGLAAFFTEQGIKYKSNGPSSPLALPIYRVTASGEKLDFLSEKAAIEIMNLVTDELEQKLGKDSFDRSRRR